MSGRFRAQPCCVADAIAGGCACRPAPTEAPDPGGSEGGDRQRKCRRGRRPRFTFESQFAPQKTALQHSSHSSSADAVDHDGTSEEERAMKILPVASLALAAALATSVLSVAPSYALQYPNHAQNCAASGTSTEGVG